MNPVAGGLVEQVRDAGVVGAGGAGFPAHIKAGARAEYVLANGAECEPLMHKDAELMARYAGRVATGMRAVMEATGAEKGLVCLKEKHVEAVRAFGAALAGTGIGLHILGDFYPTGDEYVLVHAATGRLIPPAGIPLDVGVVVQNVETLFNIAAALDGRPVTQKFVTVAGAVAKPLTTRVPIGTSFGALIDAAGGASCGDFAFFVGGAMMGRLSRDLEECVDKTTAGLIVLPAGHTLVQRQERPETAKHQIGKSACDQCSYCTELCPRYLLGYELEPHKVMRGLVFSMAGKDTWNEWGGLCCECGLCTLYACPEDLYPREACQEAKGSIRERGLEWSETVLGRATAAPPKPHPMHEHRRIPLKQLVQRLGLAEFDCEAAWTDLDLAPRRVRLALKQHAGVAALPTVAVGDQVSQGAVVGEIPAGQLGARLHASIGGRVRAVGTEIVIEAV
jgi:Na+-translocating ferredoxin:NAD+ oxidoreductase RnfC subunit